MPTKTTRRRFKDDRLLTELTERFRTDDDAPNLPFVIVNRVRPMRMIHVLVIWDRWLDLPNSERSGLITDAFHAAHPDDAPSVTVAMGLTPSEALSLGYLPYRIVPAVRPMDKVRASELVAAMGSVGGIYLQVGAEKQLRFATRAHAEHAYRDLATRLPKPIWTLIHEQPAAESA